jgi:hypothetical protein
LIDLNERGFRDLIESIVRRMRPILKKHKGATPLFLGLQRRYPFQKSIPYYDATIEFDLRTAIPSEGGPKYQPRWLSAAYGSFVKKEGSNYQIQIGVVFEYQCCPGLKKSGALDMIAAAWLSCKPLVELAK